MAKKVNSIAEMLRYLRMVPPISGPMPRKKPEYTPAKPSPERRATVTDITTQQPKTGLAGLLESLKNMVSKPTTSPPKEPAVDLNREYLAKTLWGEARGEGPEGMRAVGHVILNRLNDGRWGKDLQSVVTAPKQFSVWNKNDPNYPKLQVLKPDLPSYDEALSIADEILAGKTKDPTGGATHYHTRAVAPSWARGTKPATSIGNHLFYKGIT